MILVFDSYESEGCKEYLQLVWEKEVLRSTDRTPAFPKTEIEIGIKSLDFPCKNSWQYYYIYVMSNSAVGIAMLSG